MGGGSKTKSSSTSTYKPTAEAGAVYSNILNQAQNAAQTPYNPATQKNVAGFNSNQTAAFDNINSSQGGFQPFLNQAATYANQGAGPISAEQIAQYMNPYQQQVIDSTMANINHQNSVQQAGLLGNVAGQQGLNNSRAGVAQAELARGQNANTNATIANLMSSGFGTALGAAQNDASRQLAASGQFSNLAGQQQGLTMNDIMAQLTAGNQQQAQAQNVNDTATQNAQQQQMWPYQNTQWLAGISGAIAPLTGGTTTGNSTSSTKESMGIGQIAGTALSAMAMFSDRRLKEDVSEVGKTHDGQPIYKFRYKGSPQFQMGLMADEVEKKHPEAVGNAGGFGTVNYDMATRDSEAGGEGFAKGGGVGFPDTYFPWADLKPANPVVPQLMSSSGSKPSGGGGDMKQFADLGKSAGSGLDNMLRSADPAGGWGASIEPQGSTGGFGMLSKMFGGFAAGGGVPWGDNPFGIDPRTGKVMIPKLEDEYIGEIGDSGARPDSKLDFDGQAMGLYGRPRVDMDPRSFGLVLPQGSAYPEENELGSAPAPETNAKRLGGFGDLIARAPQFSAEKSAPTPMENELGGAPVRPSRPDQSADAMSDLSNAWQGAAPSQRTPGAGLSFDNAGFGVYGRGSEGTPNARMGFGMADSEAGEPFFMGSGEMTDGQDVPFKAQTETRRAGIGQSTRDFIKQEEGWHDRPINEGAQWTNGWGTKASGPNDVIDQKEADRRLDRELGNIDTWIDKNIKVSMTPEQRTGLTSLAFNTGIGSLNRLKSDINAGNWDSVSKRIPTFNKVRNKETGELEEVLTPRRMREAALMNQRDPLPEGDAAAGATTVRGPAPAAVAPLVERGKNPEAPTQGKYADASDRRSGGLLKRLFGVDFNPLKLDEDERKALLVAGLGMISTGNVGTGGLMGMQYLTNREAAATEKSLNDRKLALELYKADAATARKEDAPTNDIKEFNFARETDGYSGTFSDWMQAKKQREAAGSLPAEVGARIGLGNAFIADLPEIIKGVNELSGADHVNLKLGRGKAGDLWRRIESGVDAMRRNLTGAGMSASEAENYVNRYQIAPTDRNATMVSKLRLLERDLNSVSSGALSGKLGIMGKDFKTQQMTPAPELKGEAGPAKIERPSGASDDELYAEAAKALRDGKNSAAVRARLEAWGLDPSRIPQ